MESERSIRAPDEVYALTPLLFSQKRECAYLFVVMLSLF
jgi:hypothetical protein